MIIYYFAVFFIVAALIPLFRIKHWLVRGWDYIRVQTTFLQLIVLAVITTFAFPDSWWEWSITAALIATIIFQITIVLPYTSIYPNRNINKTGNGLELSLLTANVFQDNRNYDDFCQLVERYDPDVFLTMESDKYWERELDRFIPRYPYSIKVPLDNYYGMHLYSKYKLIEGQVNYLVEDGVPSIFTKVQYAPGRLLNLICVHPAPPSPSENETSKERDAELLLAGAAVRHLPSPTVVCGDLNDVVWSRISRLFKKMTGMLDPRIGRGLYPTFHAGHWYMRFPIDHMFHSRDIHITTMSRLPYYGSDHFPMFFCMRVAEQEKHVVSPHLEKSTKQDIKEDIKEGLEA